MGSINSRNCSTAEFYVHVTLHRNKFLFNKTNRHTNFPNLFLSKNSTCFRQFLWPSSVFYCTFGTGICHAGLMTAFKHDQDDHAWKLSPNLHDIYQCWMYTHVNKNPSAWNFLSPKLEVTCGTAAIIIRVVLLSPYLCIRAISLSSIHYNQSHRVYINRRRHVLSSSVNIYAVWLIVMNGGQRNGMNTQIWGK